MPLSTEKTTTQLPEITCYVVSTLKGSPWMFWYRDGKELAAYPMNLRDWGSSKPEVGNPDEQSRVDIEQSGTQELRNAISRENPELELLT